MKAVKRKPATKKKRQTNSKALAVVAKEQPQGSGVPATLSLANPVEIMEFGKVLRGYIDANKLSVKIEDKMYPLCGAWKFAGMNFGLTAIPVEIIPKHKDGQYITILYAKKIISGKKRDGTKYSFEKEMPIFCGFANHVDTIEEIRKRNTITKETTKPYYSYECKVDVTRVSDGHIVSKGTSVCTNMESLKHGFDEYAVMGMAQTRTISRALRNLLDFVLNAAGLESTPGEEMEGVQPDGYSESQYVPDAPSNKPICSEYHFKQILQRLNKGEFNMEEAKQHMTFTQDQLDAIAIMEEDYRKRNPEQQ